MLRLIKPCLYLFMAFCLLNVQLGTFRYDGRGINIDDFKSKGMDISTFTKDLNEGSSQDPYADRIEKKNSKIDFYIGFNNAYADKFKGKGKKDIVTAQYISLLTMIAVAFVIVIWMANCFGWSMGLIMAGIAALVYLVAEVMANMEFKKLKFKTVELGKKNEQGYYSDFQKKALEDEKKLYQKALKTAKLKKTLQMAAAAVFMLAAIWEYAMALMLLSKGNACTAQIKACKAGVCGTAGTVWKSNAWGCAAQPVATKVCKKSKVAGANYKAACPSVTTATTNKITHQMKEKIKGKSITVKSSLEATCTTVTTALTTAATPTPYGTTFCTGAKTTCEAYCQFYSKVLIGCPPVTTKINSPFTKQYYANINYDKCERKLSSYKKNQDILITTNNVDDGTNDSGKFILDQLENTDQLMDFFKKSWLSQGDFSKDPINKFKELFKSQFESVSPSKFKIALKQFFIEWMDQLFPKAHAFDIGMLGIAAVAVAILIGIIAAKSNFLDFMMATPFWRGLMFTIIGALCFVTVMVTDKIIKQLESNVKTLDKLLGKMRRQTDDYDIAPGDPSATTSFVKPVDTAKPYKPIELNKKVPCIKKGSGGKCVSTKSMVKGATSKLGKNEIKGLGAGTMATTSSVAGLGDSLQGKDSISGAALSQAAALGKQAAALRGKTKKLEDRINKLRKKNGLKPVDFDANRNAMFDKLFDSTAKELKANMGKGSEQLLASVGAGGRSSGLGSKGDIDKAKDALKNLKVKSNMKIVGGSGSSKKAGSGFKFDMPEDKAEDYDTLDGTAGDGLASDTASGTAEALSQYESSLDDIVKDPGVSIFKVITTRYMKKYNVFFDEE